MSEKANQAKDLNIQAKRLRVEKMALRTQLVRELTELSIKQAETSFAPEIGKLVDDLINDAVGINHLLARLEDLSAAGMMLQAELQVANKLAGIDSQLLELAHRNRDAAADHFQTQLQDVAQQLEHAMMQVSLDRQSFQQALEDAARQGATSDFRQMLKRVSAAQDLLEIAHNAFSNF